MVPTAEQSLEVLKVFGQHLPLTKDLEEATTLNHILAIELTNKNAFLIGTPETTLFTFEIFTKIKDYVQKNGAGKMTDNFTDGILASFN